MSPRTSAGVTLVVSLVVGAGWLATGVPATAQPPAPIYPADPPPQCSGGAFSGTQLLPIPGDPTAYQVCAGGLPQEIDHCPNGTLFNAAAAQCTPNGQDVAIPNISVDGISEQGDTINVNVTYSGTGMNSATVQLSDVLPTNLSAHGETSDLIADGNSHCVVVAVPAGQFFAPPWVLQPGEQVHADTQLYINGAPIHGASNGQVLTVNEPAPCSAPAGPQGPPPQGVTRWNGGWRSGGNSAAATLVLQSIDPTLTGTIVVQGNGVDCTADWTEIYRYSDNSRLVGARVTQGACSNNQWKVTVDQNRVSATDTVDPGSSLTLTRA